MKNILRTFSFAREANQGIIHVGSAADLPADGAMIPFAEYPADWNRHGKGAGPRRNQQMLDEGKPDLVVAFHGGIGTADMVRRAIDAGVPVKQGLGE